jgi:hypothetical protein
VQNWGLANPLHYVDAISIKIYDKKETNNGYLHLFESSISE